MDVDARFVLANERTLLAWVRTSLTFIAGGTAVHQLVEDPGSTAVALTLVLIGFGAALTGAVRFSASDRAVRSGQVPATGRAPYVLVGVVCTVAVAAAAIIAY